VFRVRNIDLSREVVRLEDEAGTVLQNWVSLGNIAEFKKDRENLRGIREEPEGMEREEDAAPPFRTGGMS